MKGQSIKDDSRTGAGSRSMSLTIEGDSESGTSSKEKKMRENHRQPSSESPEKKRMKKNKQSRLSLQDSHIGIIGCGMGGLSAAISLQQQGFTNISLWERDASRHERKDGYGLTLTYHPASVLAQLGLLEEVANHDSPSRAHYIFAPDGSIRGYFGNAFSASSRGKGQRGNLRVPRQVMRQIMLDKALCPTDPTQKPISIQWGKRLISFHKSSIPESNKVDLEFECGTKCTVDLLVGADGVRSMVAQRLLSHSPKFKNNPIEAAGLDRSASTGLRYLGIMIVLGIADFFHPLLDEQGFYTLDGNHRLFTMPFAGSRLDDEILNAGQSKKCMDTKGSDGTKKIRIHRRKVMWQLSYRLEDEAEAKRWSQAGPMALRDEVLRRCQSWHEPVCDMIRATPLKTVWGTGLMDRDPNTILQYMNIEKNQGRGTLPIVVLGDAVHAMSPFKGQGANQALADGPLLASWLRRSCIDAAVRGFTREMVARTAVKVAASRKAALHLHSPAILSGEAEFAGIQEDSMPQLLSVLQDRRIGAQLGRGLDDVIRALIKELSIGLTSVKKNELDLSPSTTKQRKEHALLYAASGHTLELRNMSIKYANDIRDAVDERKRSCLHLASLGGHYDTCRFLLSETYVSHTCVDQDSITPLGAAITGGDTKTILLLTAKAQNMVW